MPVTLEQIDKPGPEDLNDLVKIYQDYPKLLSVIGETTLDQWIEHKLTDDQRLFAGRFNGRLLAAIWAKPEQHSLQLEYLCVRALTRRRGVARQLLTLPIKQLNNDQDLLTIEIPAAPAALSPLLSEFGFICTQPHQDQTWTYTTKP